jgi:hypothetical protein
LGCRAAVGGAKASTNKPMLATSGSNLAVLMNQRNVASLIALVLVFSGCSRAPTPLVLPQTFALKCRSQRGHPFLGSGTGTEIILRDGARWRMEFFSDSPGANPKVVVCDGSTTQYVGFTQSATGKHTSPIEALESLYAAANEGRYRGFTSDDGDRCHRFSCKDPEPSSATFTILFYADSLLPKRYTIDTGGVKVESVYTPLPVNPADVGGAFDTNNKAPMLKKLLTDPSQRSAG